MNAAVAEILRASKYDPASFVEHEHAPDVLSGSVRGRDAQRLWTEVREAHAETGIWPIIRGGEFNADEWPGKGCPGGPSNKPFAKLLANAIRQYVSDYSKDAKGLSPTMTPAELARALDAAEIYGASPDEGRGRNESPNAGAALRLHSVRDLASGKVLKSVHLSLVRAAHPYEVVMRLGFGAYNACPASREIAVWLREWHERYGAVPACITSEVIECVVGRPPRTRKEAFKLAAEMVLFCEDIVSQGTSSVAALAREVRGSCQWFFWWD